MPWRHDSCPPACDPPHRRTPKLR
uniref:Uncharacterized protein n=1 Tax=Arundo donax TaxID=35708 RepID=A0A0A9BQB0_ARUDO